MNDQIQKLKDRMALPSHYRSIFLDTGDAGRAVMKDLAKAIAAPVFSKDPHQTSYNAGRRDFALHLLRYINTDPSELTKQLTETTTNE